MLLAFLGEAVCFGVLGALLALPLGRAMASGAVRLLSATVESLYVSSRPGALSLSVWSVALALGSGIVLALVSALSPAREASLVSPVEAKKTTPGATKVASSSVSPSYSEALQLLLIWPPPAVT